MPETKTQAADPEIPDEIKASLGKKKRPPGYVPRAGDDDDGTPEVEHTVPHLRDLRAFWKKLSVAAKTQLYRQEERTRPVTRTVKGKKVTKDEQYTVKVQQLYIGEDGMPYPFQTVTGRETNEIRARNYPGAPKMNPTLGDLTPEFVEWLYLNHTYDAAVRYAARQTHVQVAALNR